MLRVTAQYSASRSRCYGVATLRRNTWETSRRCRGTTNKFVDIYGRYLEFREHLWKAEKHHQRSGLMRWLKITAWRFWSSRYTNSEWICISSNGQIEWQIEAIIKKFYEIPNALKVEYFDLSNTPLNPREARIRATQAVWSKRARCTLIISPFVSPA
jgi:hypothetical protein